MTLGVKWSTCHQQIRFVYAPCAVYIQRHWHCFKSHLSVTFEVSFILGYTYSEDRVVRDGNLVTSRGPGTAFEFGIELVRAVRGDDGEAEKLAGPMLLK